MKFYLVVSSPAGQAQNFSVKLQKEITLDEGWKVGALQVDFQTDKIKEIPQIFALLLMCVYLLKFYKDK